MDLRPLPTAAGIGLSVVATAAYHAIGEPGARAWPQHSHVGLASLIVAARSKSPRTSSVATGFGIGLIVEDNSTPDLFGLERPDRAAVVGLYAIEVGILTAQLSRAR